MQIDGEFSYFIDIGVLGVDGNLQNKITKGINDLVARDSPEILNCNLEVTFWLSWSGDTIAVSVHW